MRSFGSGAREARQSGASLGEQTAYGLGGAVTSALAEKLGNTGVFKNAYGSGWIDDASLGTLGKLALSAVSEGAEEFAEGLADPLLKRFTYDPDAVCDNDWLRDTLYDSAVGAALGTLGGAVNVGKDESKDRVNEFEKTSTVSENGLEPLSEQERVNLASGIKNKVVSSFRDTVDFIKNALSDKTVSDRAYLGKVPDDVAQKVFVETGIDISGFTAILPSDAVRHMFKRHGDPLAESARGQEALSPETVANLPKVLSSPDRVTFSNQTDVYGRPTLLFEKQIGNLYITAQAVTEGRKALTTDTMYIKKKVSPTTADETRMSLQPNVRNGQ